MELSKEKPVRAQDIYRVLESDFVEEYHPFRYYLDHLPPWDGDDYIIELSVSVTIRGGVEKQMLFYEYLKHHTIDIYEERLTLREPFFLFHRLDYMQDYLAMHLFLLSSQMPLIRLDNSVRQIIRFKEWRIITKHFR